MIFRRVKSHIEAENWFAVFVDFSIVVLGVFIGIQVANWNAVRGAEAEYARSLSRLEAETEQNLAMLNIVEAEVTAGLDQVQSTLAALQTCDTSDPDRLITEVEESLRTIWLSRGVHLRRTALDALTNDPLLLLQQSDVERQIFADVVYFLDRLQGGSDTVEDVIFRIDVHTSPVIRVGPPVTTNFDFFGSQASRTAPELRVDAPIEELCRDAILSQNLYLWTSQQSAIPSITAGVRQVLMSLQSLLIEPQR